MRIINICLKCILKVQLLLILLTSYSISLPLFAGDTAYISDQCTIYIRSGPSTRNKIVRALRSGDTVTVLNIDDASGYTQIQSTKGDQGWVLARQLMDQPSDRERIIQVQAEVTKLTNQNQSLQDEISKMAETLKGQINSNNVIAGKNKQLASKLSHITQTAANALGMADRLKSLGVEEQELRRQVKRLEQENTSLSDSTTMYWFIIGGCTLLFGILLGLILPRFRIQRKESFDSFY